MSTDKAKTRPLTAWLLIFFMLLLGIGGLVSGPMLFLSPNGDLMGMSTDIFQGTLFPDFLVPGIILFIFVGIFPFIVAMGLLMPDWKGLFFLNPFPHHKWPWTAAIEAGIILLIWIITETALLGYISFLQPVMGAWGIIILLLTAAPGVRQYYHA